MPENPPAARAGQLTSDTAREMAERRWQRDPQGIAAAVDKIVSRSAALTGEQRDRLTQALAGDDDA